MRIASCQAYRKIRKIRFELVCNFRHFLNYEGLLADSVLFAKFRFLCSIRGIRKSSASGKYSGDRQDARNLQLFHIIGDYQICKIRSSDRSLVTRENSTTSMLLSEDLSIVTSIEIEKIIKIPEVFRSRRYTEATVRSLLARRFYRFGAILQTERLSFK